MNLRKDHYRDTEVVLRSRRASQKERTRLTRAKGGARGEHAARRSKRTLRTRLEKKVPAQRDGCARDRRVAGDGRTDGRKANRERAGLGASTRRGDRKEHCERKKLVGELTDGARRPTSSEKRRESQRERRSPRSRIVHARCSPKIRSMQQAAADGEIIEIEKNAANTRKMVAHGARRRIDGRFAAVDELQ